MIGGHIRTVRVRVLSFVYFLEKDPQNLLMRLILIHDLHHLAHECLRRQEANTGRRRHHEFRLVVYEFVEIGLSELILYTCRSILLLLLIQGIVPANLLE